MPKHPIIGSKAFRDVHRIMTSGELSGFRGAPGQYFLGGRNVRKLEEAFCKKFNIKYAVSMNSATACLHVALIACGVGPGDEVVVSPYSFSSSASCALMVGAKPVFVDIDKEDFGIARFSEAYINEKTKAIIPVHLMGHPCDMRAMVDLARNYKLKLIEDAAQAIGATRNGEYIGTIGDCGIFSFNQSKQVSCGEGGMLITNNENIARVARALRNHAEVSADMKIVGFNYRMNEIEAAIVLEQFNRLSENIAYRNSLATYLSEKLKGIPGITPPVIKDGCTHSFYTYGVKVDESIIGMTKQELTKRLNERGVYFGDYVKPLYLLPIYEQFGYKEGLCPRTEQLWKHELIVTDRLRFPARIKDIDFIAQTFKEVLSARKTTCI